jgi:hypothetical protein
LLRARMAQCNSGKERGRGNFAQPLPTMRFHAFTSSDEA